MATMDGRTSRAIATAIAGLFVLAAGGGGCNGDAETPSVRPPSVEPLGADAGAAALGTPCGDPSECASGFCAFGVCCNTECITYCGFDALGCPSGTCQGMSNPGYCWCPYCGPEDTTSFDQPTFTCFGIPHCVCPTRQDGSICHLANNCGQCIAGKCEKVLYPDGTRCCTGQDCASGHCVQGLPWTPPPCGPFTTFCGGAPGTCVGASACTSGDGQFCGAALGLDASTLFQCTGGAISVAAQCTAGCQQNGNGTDACVCLPDGAPCDDGDACTIGDTVQSCLCTSGAPVSCPPPDECHEPGACNPQDGTCSSAQKPDGAPCSQGVCSQGTCVSTTGNGSSSTSTTGGATSSGASTGSGGAGGAPTSGVTTGNGGASTGSGGAAPGDGAPKAGGSCATTPNPTPSPAWLALAIALAARRRRR